MVALAQLDHTASHPAPQEGVAWTVMLQVWGVIADGRPVTEHAVRLLRSRRLWTSEKIGKVGKQGMEGVG
jgi:hypothetical protein